MSDLVTGALAVVGAALVALAGVGVVRFGDLYARMHAATKAPTLGLLLIVGATAVELPGAAGKLVLAIALIFITAPVAAHLVARAAYDGPGGRARVDADDELGPSLDRPAEPGG
jgi:multicomponent Na+:H+ antiporter subunit G